MRLLPLVLMVALGSASVAQAGAVDYSFCKKYLSEDVAYASLMTLDDQGQLVVNSRDRAFKRLETKGNVQTVVFQNSYPAFGSPNQWMESETRIVATRDADGRVVSLVHSQKGSRLGGESGLEFGVQQGTCVPNERWMGGQRGRQVQMNLGLCREIEVLRRNTPNVQSCDRYQSELSRLIYSYAEKYDRSGSGKTLVGFNAGATKNGGVNLALDVTSYWVTQCRDLFTPGSALQALVKNDRLWETPAVQSNPTAKGATAMPAR